MLEREPVSNEKSWNGLCGLCGQRHYRSGVSLGEEPAQPVYHASVGELSKQQAFPSSSGIRGGVLHQTMGTPVLAGKVRARRQLQKVALALDLTGAIPNGQSR